MNPRVLIPTFLILMSAAMGCGKAAPAPSGVGVAPAQKDLAAKLQSMTPEERARYVRENPQEVSSTFSQVGGGGQ